MSAGAEHLEPEPAAERVPPARRALPTEARRGIVATLLGAAVGVIAVVFSRREDDGS